MDLNLELYFCVIWGNILPFSKSIASNCDSKYFFPNCTITTRLNGPNAPFNPLLPVVSWLNEFQPKNEKQRKLSIQFALVSNGSALYELDLKVEIIEQPQP